MSKKRLPQDVTDALFETVIEMVTYQDGKTIANTFYDKNPSLIKEKLNLSTKEQFVKYIDKTNGMSMKMAEYAIDGIVKSVFKIARSFKINEAEKLIVDYFDSDYKVRA